MVKCMVPGCKNKARGSTFEHYHVFPWRDPALCKAWLVAINHPEYGPNTPLDVLSDREKRVCSDHFLDTDYRGGVAKSHSARLNSEAVPSVFPWSGASSIPTTTPSQLQVTSPVRPADMSLFTRFRLSSPAQPLRPRQGPSTSGMYFGTNPALEPAKRQKVLDSFMVNTQHLQIDTAGVSDVDSLPDSLAEMDIETCIPLPTTSTPSSKRPRRRLAASFHTSFSSVESPQEPPDTSFRPLSSTSQSSSDTHSSDVGQNWMGKKWIVNESRLFQLFTVCRVCGKPISEMKTTERGSQISISWLCLDNHTGVWTSCPDVRGLAENNLLASSAILFTGGTYTDISDWSNLLNLQIPRTTSFYTIQSSYLLPAIEEEYKSQNKDIMNSIVQGTQTGPGIDVCGDGRSDSPGYSAKYTTYSFMDDATKKVIHYELVQVTEASSSVAMEPVGFERGMQKLLDSGVKINCMTTDRSPSIKKRMRENYPSISHQYDPWHLVKGIKKKLRAQATKKPNRELNPWIKSIGHHFWFACSTCGGDAEKLKKRWKSVLYHIRGIHIWTEDGKEVRCLHRDLTEDEEIRKRWLSKDSPAYKVLCNIVLDQALMKDLDHLTQFKHTGALEVFHSEMLKYTPKRLHFSYPVMAARTQLAVLDHNENVGRKQAVTAEGVPRYNLAHSKQAKQWVAKDIHERKTYHFREKLVERVLERRCDATIKFNDPTSRVITPNLPHNIASVERPHKAETVAKRLSRFRKSDQP